VIRPAADRDIDAIADYLADEASLATALDFLSEAYRAFSVIEQQPGIGHVWNASILGLSGIRVFRMSERFLTKPCGTRVTCEIEWSCDR
jgi:plasmid stabilization system protein ParE